METPTMTKAGSLWLLAPAPHADLQLQNRFSAQVAEKGAGSSIKVSMPAEPKPCRSSRKKWWVIVVGDSQLQCTEADMTCHIVRLAGVMILTRIPLYIEELVIHITVCLSRSRLVLCCIMLHYSGLCCTGQIPWLQDKQPEHEGSSHYVPAITPLV